MEKTSSICFKILSLLSLISLTFASAALHALAKILSKIGKQTTPGAPLPPGPDGWPLVGCLPQMIKNRPVFRWMHNIMWKHNKEIACIRLGGTHMIPIASPELAREVVRKQDETFAARPDCMSGRLCSSNYLTAVMSPSGLQWKKMRKVLSVEVLAPSIHKFFHAKRCEEADHLVRYVLNQCDGADNQGLVDVRVATQHYCGNMIRKMVFGKRFFGPGAEDGGPGPEENEHVAGLFSMLELLYGFNIADYVPWVEVFDFDGNNEAINKCVSSVTKYHDPEITKRVEMWRKGIKTTEDDILDVFINLKDLKTDDPSLSIPEIKAQIVEIMMAAVDNPSNAVEWGIAEMINHPHILHQAWEELDRVVGRDRLVQESDIPKLNYIKSCVKESFRLHPISGFNLPHVATRDTTVGGYFIPKGSQILLSRPGLGRNPRVWEDPLEYKPERHMINGEDKEVGLVDLEFRLISFGTGRRGCPGVVLGTAMCTMLLARLLQGFTWAAPHDGPGCIDLAESENNMLMAKPLIAAVKPRLELKVYQQLMQNE